MRVTPTSPASYTSHPLRRADDVAAETVAAQAGTALVATSPTTRSAPPSGYGRPDPTFIAHLIATAEQSPQTRVLRRADVSDVQAAYRAVANQNAGAASFIVRMTA
jgi:hypothetical protein